MTAPSSDSAAPRPAHRLVEGERGAVLLVVVLSLVVLVGTAGIAVDLGLGYLEKVRLGRAVDAGALAGARNLRSGEAVAREEAEAVARANGVAPADNTTTAIGFGVNERGEREVVFSADRVVPTIFMKMLGIHEMPIAAEAAAAVPPLDVVLVLDVSGSLDDAGAFGDLQEAATTFVQQFDDQLDQLGLVSFQLGGTELVELSQFFTVPMIQQIDGMVAGGDTNAQEGLRIARERLDSPQARPAAAKVLVFFTDGNPTAMRGTFGGQDRIAAAFRGTSTQWRGFFANPDDLPPFQIVHPSGHGQANWPGGCPGVTNCFGISAPQLRDMAADAALQEAHTARDRGMIVYSLGLGTEDDPNVPPPDLPYLREIANEDGMSNPSQPEGRLFYAPTGADLQQAFRELAQDLIVRLAR